MSALYHKRSPDFSSTGALHTKGSSNLKKDGAESMMGKGINCLFFNLIIFGFDLLMNAAFCPEFSLDKILSLGTTIPNSMTSVHFFLTFKKVQKSCREIKDNFEIDKKKKCSLQIYLQSLQAKSGSKDHTFCTRFPLMLALLWTTLFMEKQKSLRCDQKIVEICIKHYYRVLRNKTKRTTVISQIYTKYISDKLKNNEITERIINIYARSVIFCVYLR